MVESGNHDELMSQDSYYRKLVDKQEGAGDENKVTPISSRNNSEVDLIKLSESAAGSMEGKSGAAHIEFKDVDFSYPTRPNKKIFDTFNLVIPQGSSMALVGPSGGGKSTTVGLIERFYDPSGGVIEYMGHDVKSLNVGWYRDQIGYVGQEPTLFNDTIARNIAYGAPGASQADIEEAAKQANCHDFIMEFPESYDTLVGERGAQLSGGQKQRVAIARALIKNPQLLILDEATSALDNESEAIVQAAIDNLMQSRKQTVVLIAHRLSTIRNADCIALISEGKVIEYGSHDELIEKPNGRYKRLFDSSKRHSTMDSMGLRNSIVAKAEEDTEKEEEEVDWDAKIEEDEVKAFNSKRAREMAKPDASYMLIGSIGAVMAGGVFPMWGVLFAQTIDLLFQRVEDCPDPSGDIPGGFINCPAYWKDTADDMRSTSFSLAGYWLVVVAGCILGNILTFWGFGMASERLNKRVRDTSFTSLLRQEVSFFDMRSVGSITSQLQDDAARIQAFSGEPVRSLIVALSSVLTGVILSFIVSDRRAHQLDLSIATTCLTTLALLLDSSCGRLLSLRSRVSLSWALRRPWK
jgi:ATP-binding cassette subfamily B (MDR/TAP) protein 1